MMMEKKSTKSLRITMTKRKRRNRSRQPKNEKGYISKAAKQSDRQTGIYAIYPLTDISYILTNGKHLADCIWMVAKPFAFDFLPIMTQKKIPNRA
jgi:hypothetical protein